MTGTVNGELLFGGFCALWLLVGTFLLLARIAEGARRLDDIKFTIEGEKRFLADIEAHIRAREAAADEYEGEVVRRQGELSLWQGRLDGLAAKPSPQIVITGREPPKPSERLWVAVIDSTSPLGQRFAGAWAEDAAHARAKMVVAFGDGSAALGNVVPIAQLKSSLLY